MYCISMNNNTMNNNDGYVNITFNTACDRFMKPCSSSTVRILFFTNTILLILKVNDQNSPTHVNSC